MHALIFREIPANFMQILNFLLPMVSLLLTVVGLETDLQYIALAGGSAVAGSLLLGYFRPEKTLGSQVNKMAMATIGGLIAGSAFIQWRQIDTPAYISLAFCTCSMLVLIFVRTFVSLTEANAGTLTTTLIQRIFNVKLSKDNADDDERPRRRRSEVLVSQKPHEAPTVIIGETAKPDEIRVIEQTIVEKKD